MLVILAFTKMIKRMGQVSINGKMEIYIQANGRRTKFTGLGSLYGKTGESILESETMG